MTSPLVFRESMQAISHYTLNSHHTPNSAFAFVQRDKQGGKAAVLDWDKVFSHYEHNEYMAEVGAIAGLTVDEASGLILPNNRMLALGLIDLETFTRKVVSDFEKYMGKSVLREEDVMWLEYYRKIKLDEALFELVKRRHDPDGFPFAIMTAQDSTRSEIIHRQLTDHDLDIPVILPSDTGFAKDDPRAYLRLLVILRDVYGWSFDPKFIAFVDDVLSNVTTATMATGMHGIHYIADPGLLDRRLEQFRSDISPLKQLTEQSEVSQGALEPPYALHLQA